jgi:hypothetical protein
VRKAATSDCDVDPSQRGSTCYGPLKSARTTPQNLQMLQSSQPASRGHALQ